MFERSDYCWYKRVADERACFFFDVADVIEPSSTDGVHLDELQHQQFASRIHRCVSELLDVPIDVHRIRT